METEIITEEVKIEETAVETPKEVASSVQTPQAPQVQPKARTGAPQPKRK